MDLGRHPSLAALVLAILGCTGVFQISAALAQQKHSGNRDLKAASVLGQNTFNSSCAGCHGLDGRGNDKAVNISGSARVRHLSDGQLASLISKGIPGTGMPGFASLGAPKIHAVVGYVRSLQGKAESRSLPGDATRGKETFFGKGQCSTCHMVSGQGGFLGPDLSAYGSSASATAIHDEIVRTQRTASQGYRRGVITTNNGDRLEGIIRNEDNFSVQFQTQDGTFHFYQKSELQNLEHLDSSIMPTNYRERFSPGELNDLVSYLMSVAPDDGKGRPSHRKEEDIE